MQMIRETLGEEAIIISTREENGGRSVQVTAALEQERERDQQEWAPGRGSRTGRSGRAVTGQPAPRFGDPGDWLYDDDDDRLGVVEDLTETMLRHGAPDEVIEQIVSYSAVMGLDEPHIALLEALRGMFGFSPLPCGRIEKPLMMVGPPGSGKTLATAKLAARGVMNGLNMSVVTTDLVRAGGVEQLEAFTRILEIRLGRAGSIKTMKETLMRLRNADQVIIDTAGINPFDSEDVKALARLIGAARAMPVLVLPAGADADESAEIARVFETIGVQHLMPSRMDAARRFGGLLAAAYQGKLSFTDMSDTPQVADGLTPLNAKSLTTLLMPRIKEGKISNRRTIERRHTG